VFGHGIGVKDRSILLRADRVSLAVVPERSSTRLVGDVSLALHAGETLGLLGPNGCGKTSLLRVLAGVLPATGGTVTRAKHASLGMISQHVHSNLLPWLNGADNVALPDRVKGRGVRRGRRRAIETLRTMELSHLADRYPHQLSGGQQQLLALARWLANPPSVLLIDEGWSMLDFVQRERLYAQLRGFVERGARAVCLVSHNLGELAGIVDRAYVVSGPPANLAHELRLTASMSRADRVEALWESAQRVFAIPPSASS
jgi:NitT/TauT family transport system ATP-binding protein